MGDKIRFKASEIQGSYEPSDSEDDYTAKEKSLLNKIRKPKHDSGSEEEVYAFSDSEDDSDAKQDDLDIADSDVEGQEKSDDDLPDSKAWGTKKRSYYATDYVDEDYGGFGDDEDMALMEEEEAKSIQKRLLEKLSEDDFSLEFFTSQLKDSGEKETIIKSDVSKMSKREKLQLLEKESPEFASLIEDFKTKLTVAKDDLHPVLKLLKVGKLPKCPASNFVKTNFDLILNYCTNISFYLLLKSQRVNIQNHPVIKRLYQYRQMLNKLEPVYLEVIKPQIDKILHAVNNNLDIQFVEQNQTISKKRKSEKSEIESSHKKLKLINMLEKDDDEDTGVSDDDEFDGDDFFKPSAAGITQNDKDSEESGFSDNEDDLQQPENIVGKSSTSTQDLVTDDIADKRKITYQIAKNKGLTPHRKKEQRNPRVKHKLKFRKAKIRRKGAVREVRKEINKYGGEVSGIKANVKKGIKIK